MRKLNDNQLQNLEAGKFWGWSCGSAFQIEDGSCYRVCTYTILGFTSSTDVYTCSNLPGSNPDIK